MKEIKLQKDQYLRINEFCILANIRRWGSKNENDYVYVLALKSYPKCEDTYEVYGAGDSAISAMLSGIKTFTDGIVGAICIKSLFDMEFKRICALNPEKDGYLPALKEYTLPIKHNANGEDFISNCHVYTEGDNAYPILI